MRLSEVTIPKTPETGAVTGTMTFDVDGSVTVDPGSLIDLFVSNCLLNDHRLLLPISISCG